MLTELNKLVIFANFFIYRSPQTIRNDLFGRKVTHELRPGLNLSLELLAM